MCSCNNKYNNNKYNDNKYSDYDSSYNDNIITVKQISFQINWVNTQAFYSIGYWPFQWVSLYLISRPF